MTERTIVWILLIALLPNGEIHRPRRVAESGTEPVCWQPRQACRLYCLKGVFDQESGSRRIVHREHCMRFR